MEHQLECEFVVLAYASDATQEGLLPVAIAARELSSGEARGLILHVPAVLGTTVSRHHLDYLYELFESWREVARDRLDDLFHELRELSAGPLRTQDAGYCSSRDLPRLVNQVFGANEPPGRAHG